MASRDVCISEVTSVLSRNHKLSQPSTSNDVSLQETNNSHVSNQMTVSLKRFSSTPTLNRRSIVDSNIEFNINCPVSSVQIPIVGYEVMEERARFTVYKLRINNQNFGDCWFVFRRYTDFVRLNTKLKAKFPKMNLTLPRKRWFGDNFDSRFIEQRIKGLQNFIDCISKNEQLMKSSPVREFFCLDHPPTYIEAGEENRAIFEALEETIYQLRQQLVKKEEEYESLRANLMMEQERISDLASAIRQRVKNCEKCETYFQELTDEILNSSKTSRTNSHDRIFTSSPIISSSPSSRNNV